MATDETERKDTLQQPVIQPQPSQTGYRSGTLDAILNAQRQQPVLRPDVKTQTMMDQWGQNHFVPDSRLTGQTPRDAMNAWSLFHGGQTPVQQQQPAQTEQPAQTAEAPRQEVPTFGEDLRNEWRGFTDLFRKKENRKYDPTLGKYNVPPPGPDADLSEWTAWFQNKKDYEDEVARTRQQRNLNVSSLGDMFNALSNLYYTSQYAPSWYSGKESMTDKQRERYDKLNAAKDASDQAYLNMYLKAGNDQEANKLAWEKMKQEADRWNLTFNYQKDKDDADRQAKIDMNNANNEAADKRNRDNIEAANARNDANNRAAWKLAKDKQDWKNATVPGSGSNDKNAPVPLVDGKSDSQYRISRSVWDYGYPQAFDALSQDLIDNGIIRQYQIRNMKPSEKEDLVKQYWYMNDDVKDYLLKLANTDPATMESRTDHSTEHKDRDENKPVVNAAAGSSTPQYRWDPSERLGGLFSSYLPDNT